MKIPEQTNTIESLIYAAYEADQEPPRPHMGASQLGHPCDRWLWLQFRHAVIERHNGRMLLLFKRGHEEEAKVVQHLRKIGAHVQNVGSNQIGFDFGSHVKGSADGVVSGLPQAPKTKAILECKTHSDKSFKELKTKGVKEAKPMHWIQCCVYGYGAKIDRALYFAINKNTDEIYTEWLHLDKEVAIKAIERGQRIALTDRMPEPLSADPSWHHCKFCDGHDQCFGSKTTKHVNCRTCAHSTAKSDSTWHCAKWDDTIPLEAQRTGCESHVLHPDLVPWQRKDGPDEWTAVYVVGGMTIANGDPEQEGVYSSRELLANAAACASGDSFIAEMRRDFGGRIVG
jgi:hypothetical protein